ncbi:MAG TPA: pseudouridine synthase [Candidatus Dormibacteraeota bacterium]|nr:pseudouridine synthase [Candidatus Dormibacteraeota bacterium]
MSPIPPPARTASTLRLPVGAWRTVLDCLCDHFVAVSREQWLCRMARGRVLDADWQAIGPDHRYRAGLVVHYFREVPEERPIPGVERLIHVDEHLVVADKPHFLPVIPGGRFVRETLLTRLIARLHNPDLVPLHRIDRGTAGLVMFSACRATRSRYHALFRDGRITKHYEAIAPALPALRMPYTRETRLGAGTPFFRMREIDGAPNARTRIEILQTAVASRGPKNDPALEPHWRYRLTPSTGKKHQLRVHMAALGAAIDNDPFYPDLTDEQEDDHEAPLKLLARGLAFADPLTGAPRTFSSAFEL